MERNVWVDRSKGYACFLVLFGHVIMGMRKAGIDMPGFFSGMETFIWSFHVALFLFLSGLVYQMTGGWESKRTKRAFLRYKLINLGVPYLVFSAIYILINSLVPSVNTASSVSDILFLWREPVAQYWYLYALFFLFCLWTVLSGTFRNWEITAGTVAFSYLAAAFGVELGSFAVVFSAALAFGLGTCVPLSRLERVPVWGRLLVISGHLLFGTVMIRFGVSDQPLMKELLLVLGIAASLFLVSLLTRSRLLSRLLDFMNRYSFQIYLLHTIFTAGIRILLLRFGVTQWCLHLVCGCVGGILCSVLAAWLAKRFRVLNLCFFPIRTWRELSKSKQRV